MADERITFRIGSVFEGEGFKRASNTVNQMNQNLKKGMETSSQMAAMMGQLDQSTGKATVAVTGMLQALLSMNVTVIASQAAMLALNTYVAETNKKLEETKKRAEELKAAMDKAFSNAIADDMAKFRTDVKSIGDEFDLVTKQANALTAAINGVNSATNAGGIASLQVEKLQAMIDAHTEEERSATEAAYNLKIAQEKAANVEEESAAKVQTANQARMDNINKLLSVDEQLRVTRQKVAELEELQASKTADVSKQLAEAKAKEAELVKQQSNLRKDGEVAEQNYQKALIEAETAQKNATAEVMNAELADKKRAEAAEKLAAQEAEDEYMLELEASAAEVLKDAEKDRADALKKSGDLQKEADDAAKSLAKAEADYAKALDNYSKNMPELLTKLAASAIGSNRGNKSQGLLPVDVQKGIALTVADKKVDDAIRNGAVTTVKDADRLQRQAMRDARNAISEKQTQQLNEAKKYKRLQEMNPKALASSDKDFMAKYEKIQAAAEKRKKDLEDTKEALEKEKKAVEDSKKNLDDIKKLLEKLGCK